MAKKVKRIKKTYVAHDLSRERFLTKRANKRNRNKAKLYHGYYCKTEKVVRGKKDNEGNPTSDYCIAVRPVVKRYTKARCANGWASQLKKINNRRIRHMSKTIILDADDEIVTKLGNNNNYRKQREYAWEID